MYQQHLQFVQETLIQNHGIHSHREEEHFRSRFSHILRVKRWTEILSKGLDVNPEILALSALFHDVGYSTYSERNLHGQRGSIIFREYAESCPDIPSAIVDTVAYNIAHHSDKHLLHTNISLELTLLMEADSIDEEGPVRILRDCMIVGQDPHATYEKTYQRLVEFQMKECPLVTAKAKEIWAERYRLNQEFLSILEKDLFL